MTSSAPPPKSQPRRHPDQHDQHQAVDTAVKSIFVFKNGDLFYPSKRIVINKRQTRTWDAFLEQLTTYLKPRRGAIRNIHTPHHGTPVRALEDITAQGNYVAVASGERLKLDGVDYDGIQKKVSKPKRPANFRNSLRPIQPVYHSKTYRQEGGRITQLLLERKNKTIQVFRNGDEFTRAIIVLLTKFEQLSMDLVMRSIGERVVLPSNRPIMRLYTIDGHKVNDPLTIEEDKEYVAASWEPFKHCPYGREMKRLVVGKYERRPYEGIKFLNALQTPPQAKGRASSDPTPRTGRSDVAAARSRRGKAKRQYYGDDAELDDDEYDDVREVDYDEDRGGVYKAKRRSRATAGAREVEENRQTRTDRHVDRRRAKPIEEEEIEDEDEPLTSRKKYRHPRKARKPPTNPKENAVITIQSNYRGYKTRKEIADERSKPKPPAYRRTQKKSKSQPPKHKDTPRRQEKPKYNVKPATRKAPKRAPKRQTEDPEEERRHEAAACIQSSYRGYKTRDANRQQAKAARAAEAAEAAPKPRPPAQKQPRRSEKPKYKTAVRKAPKRVRKRQTNDPEEEKRHEAAACIQSSYRGYKTRASIHTAAVQETVTETPRKKPLTRSRNTPRRPTKTSDPKAAKEHEAATAIQSSYRGYKTRQSKQAVHQPKSKQVTSRKEKPPAEKGKIDSSRYADENALEQKHVAVVTIQRSYRGYRTRNNIRKRRSASVAAEKAKPKPKKKKVRVISPNEDRAAAATVIQSSYRGHRTRKRIAARRKR